MFKDPAAPKSIHPKRKELPGGDYSSYFANPGHDKLMSGHIQCGEDFGVGHKTPVGKDKSTGKAATPPGAFRYK